MFYKIKEKQKWWNMSKFSSINYLTQSKVVGIVLIEYMHVISVRLRDL